MAAGKASTRTTPKKAKKAKKAKAAKKKKGRGRMSARSDSIARARLELENLPLTLVCEVMGVPRQTVYEWVEKGAPRNEDGSFHLAEFVKWRLDALLNRSFGEADSPELERFRAARADIVEMDRDTRRGLLIEKVDVDRREIEQVEVLKRGFTIMTKRVRAEVGADAATVVRREVRDLMTEIGGGNNGHAGRTKAKKS